MKLSRLLFLDWVEEFGDWIYNKIIEGVVGLLLWNISIPFFWMINLCEHLYRKFAGLEVVYDNGTAIEGDIVVYLVQSDIVQNVFFSVLILGLFLLVIFTILAIVKNQYAEKPKPVSGIIGNSFKGLFYFWLVPVVCITGLAVGNVVLRMVDEATSTQVGGSGGASDMLFIAACYSANELREDDLEDCRDELIDMFDDGILIDELKALGINSKSDCEDASRETLNEIANMVDTAFVNGELGGWDKYNFVRVNDYYDMISINYIILWVGGVFLCYCLVIITWGLLGRIFKMAILYAFSPAVLAVYPHDEGKAFKSWKDEFTKNATMGYTSVATLNIFYSILPVINRFDFYESGGFVNSFIQLLIMISAFMMVKDFLGTVAGWFGTGDAYKAGKDTYKSIKDGAKVAGKGMKKVSGTFAGIRGGWDQAKQDRGNRFIGALTGGMSAAGVKNPLTEFSKTWQKTKKESGTAYEDFVTNVGGKQRRDAAKDRIAVSGATGGKADKKLASLISEYDDTIKAIAVETDLTKKAELEVRAKNILGKINDSAWAKQATKKEREEIAIAEKRSDDEMKMATTLESFGQVTANVQTLSKSLGVSISDILAGKYTGKDRLKSNLFKEHLGEILSAKSSYENQVSSLSTLRDSNTAFGEIVAKNQTLTDLLSGKGLENPDVAQVMIESKRLLTEATKSAKKVEERKKAVDQTGLEFSRKQHIAVSGDKPQGMTLDEFKKINEEFSKATEDIAKDLDNK